LSDLTGLLNVDASRARAELAKHTSEILMIPELASNGKRYYVAAGGWNLFGGGYFRMVAGACFEAIHNALGAWLVRRWLLPKNGRRPKLASSPAGGDV
jgi:hypothetical protein